MPLLKMSKEFMQDVIALNPIIGDITELFTSMQYLGSDNTGLSPCDIFLVSVKGFEPGEYFVEIIQTVKIEEDGPSYHHEVKRAKDA